MFQLAMPETQRHSIFERVQRLRSARANLPSTTTDSDSDVPTKTPPRRESPRIRKRESPKTRRKESPKTRKKDSPSLKRRESPQLKKKDSFSRQQSIPEGRIPERSIERSEEYVTESSNVLSTKKIRGQQKMLTITLPTAKVTLPQEVKGKSQPGVMSKSLITEGKPSVPTIREKERERTDTSSDSSEKKVQTAKGTEPKFPELLIPEWKKKPQTPGVRQLQRVPHIESDEAFESEDNEVFVPERTRVQETMIIPARSRLEETGLRLLVDKSFDGSETSEDTLKYLTPDLSPAVRQEPLKYPEIKEISKTPPENIETASDPGQSRPHSMIKVHIETHGTPLLLRKPPTGYHMRGRIKGHPQSSQVPSIPLKQIKPAQELLDESQRYRSGQSIYLTRILKRYPMKIECRSRSIDTKATSDKESVKPGYVKSIVKQLSREGTPDSRGSKGSPQIAKRAVPESPKSEFVTHIVRKLSSPTEASIEKSIPIKELTNGGQVQKLKKAYAGNLEGTGERRYSETLVVRKKDSPDIQPYESSSSTSSTLTFSNLGSKSDTSQGNGSGGGHVTYSSMPMLSLVGEEYGRERSATGSSSSPRGQSHSPLGSPSTRHRVHVAVSLSPGKSRRIIDPTLSPARMRRLLDPSSPGRRRRIHEPSPIEILPEEPGETTAIAQQSASQLSPPLSPSTFDVKKRSPKTKRKDKSKTKGTIELLCRQSMTFDLGVSMQAQEEMAGAGGEGDTQRSQTLPIRHSTSSTTSASSQSEIEGATGSSGEKKKSRHKKFMDSTFIQKSKKFFKVSK